MANPFGKLKKIRSLDEALTRGGQAFAAFREQHRPAGLPSEQKFVRLIDPLLFGNAPIIAETVWQRFFSNGDRYFFPSVRQQKTSAAEFRENFGEERVAEILESARRIAGGRIDLLGYKNLYIGIDVDWHREPLSSKRSPLRYWKEFDEIPASETGDKKIIWELNRHQHFFTLGVAYWLTGDERYARAFARHIESWIAQNPPGRGINWASSLEVSFRAMSWLWAFHFFRNSDAFTPDLFIKALKVLYCHARHIENYLSVYYSPNTHLTGEALGLYYLGTQMRCFKRAASWRKTGENILFDQLPRQILPDGVYFEQSTWYQRYTVDFYAQFTILKTLDTEPPGNRREGEFEERLRLAFDHLMHVTQPDGTTPLIGDDDGGRLLPLTGAESDDFRGSLAVAAVLFGRGDYKLAAGSLPEDVFWLLGAEGIDAWRLRCEEEPADTSAAYPEGGYFVMRDGWSSTDNFLIVDCGEVGSLAGGHGHADALSIEMAIGGRTLLVDSGTYTYHESAEMRDYFRGTTAHNTLVIDGLSSSEPGGTFGWKSRAEAELRSWVAEDRFDFFEGLHRGYERLKSPATHTRSILFLKGDYWIMRDFVKTAGDHEYSLNFHLAEGIRSRISARGGFVGDEDHRIFTFALGGEWRQNESWISRVHGRKKNSTFMRYVSSGQGPQEFFTFILPAGDHDVNPVVTEVESELGRAFLIKFHGYNDLFVLNDSPGTSIDTGVFASNFRYSWARLSEGETVPDEFVLIDGDMISVGDSEIIGSKRAGYASIRRLGRQLYLKDEKGRKKISL